MVRRCTKSLKAKLSVVSTAPVGARCRRDTRMQINLSEKVALVTGASRGIGRAIAVALAASGATVVVNYKGNQAAADGVVQAIEQAEPAEGLAAPGKAFAIQADVSDAADVDRLFKTIIERAGRIDILVNN